MPRVQSIAVSAAQIHTSALRPYATYELTSKILYVGAAGGRGEAVGRTWTGPRSRVKA